MSRSRDLTFKTSRVTWPHIMHPETEIIATTTTISPWINLSHSKHLWNCSAKDEKKHIENTLGNLSLLLQIYINVVGLMIESYDIESFERVVALKKRIKGVWTHDPFLLYVHCKNMVLSDTSSLRTLAPSEKKKFLNKMVNTKNENVLDIWRKRK